MVIPGHVQVEEVGVQPGPAMSRPPADTGGRIGDLSIPAQTFAIVGPLQRTFALVPPDRYEKSLLLGLTLLPPGLFQTPISPGVAGEYVWFGPSSQPMAPTEATAVTAARVVA